MNMHRSRKITIGMAVVAIAIIAFFVYVFTYTGPLESIRMGTVNVRPGDLLSQICGNMNDALAESGEGWRVIVDPKDLGRTAHSNFGWGGSAIGIAVISKNFGCRTIVIKKEKILLVTSHAGDKSR